MSTQIAQVCAIAGSLRDEEIAVLPDDHGDVVLTVQTDCATGLTHPSGSLPAVHESCDASHTVVADLISRDGGAFHAAARLA